MTQPAQAANLTSTALKADVSELLLRFCATKLHKAARMDAGYAEFWRAIQTLASKGGKYMRPSLTLWAYDMYGGKNRDGILHVAVAQELLHLSMLVHDDIIDRDEVRYGIPNVAGQYHEKYSGQMSDGDAAHYSSSAALLAGDVLLSGSYEIILNSPLQPQEKITAMQLIADSIFMVVGGELADTESVLQPMLEADPLAIAVNKTAVYSFVGPLLSGAMLAGAEERQLELLRSYGIALGTAFQLADDLLGIFGDEAVTGKSAITDIKEAKRTYLMQRVYELSSDAERTELDGLVGNPELNSQQAERVRTIVRECGAEAATRAKIVSYTQQAAAALGDIDVEHELIQPLYELLQTATERTK